MAWETKSINRKILVWFYTLKYCLNKNISGKKSSDDEKYISVNLILG